MSSNKQDKKDERIEVVDSTPFPVPELYFRVYDSEKDEPESKVRGDVNKLYERWIKKYGRRWPEHGLGTEDMVWLDEESHKPMDENGEPIPASMPTRPPSAFGLTPVEQEAYDNEFIPEPYGDAGYQPGKGDGAAAGGKASRARRAASTLSNYEATKAGANWVTDEFESEDYEAGNLETLWNMYLWDREGVPTIMPDGPPDEAQGEESEDFDDFYTAYRPRYVNSEEAREAVWATDEFESDEDNTESEWEPEYVGAGLGLDAEDPINPQYSLRHSAHPLAPFPGEPLKWASYVYDDGTTYEGLTRDAVPHGMGVMVFGNGTGAGFHFRDVARGDKYEGEFQAGYAHGLGQFTSETRGEVFVGEFFAGQRHGCGIKVNMRPFYYLLEHGDDPVSAYQKTYDQVMRNIEFRTWYRNKALGSDYEDETVLTAIRDDFDNPYSVVLRNARHEQKLKDWKKMSADEKALTKMVEIIEKVGSERASRRAAMGFSGSRYFGVDGEGKLAEDLDTFGNDSDYDSIDLMVGNETDGMPGLGWNQDTQDTEDFPFDDKLLELVNAEAVEDKMEESEDKEAILGQDMLNPFTGLSLKDYLDGKEGKYKELLALHGGSRDVSIFDGEHSSLVEDDVVVKAWKNSGLTPAQQEMLLEDMERYEREFGDDWQNEHELDGTDTRFETESDMMDLCDLAEILGTVDEAQEIVARARMWRWKPYGEATIRFAQDANGVPVSLMQDPLHYPHGTKFMAPGPLGQCHPIPDDPNIRVDMARHAQNHRVIHDRYNFDWDAEPGSVQYKIDQRIKRAQELRMSSLARLAEAADEVLAEEAVAAEQQQPAELLASIEGVLQPASSSSSGSSGRALVPANPFNQGSAFASMSFGMSKASRVVMDTLTHAAKHVPTRRPRLVRPSDLKKAKPVGREA